MSFSSLYPLKRSVPTVHGNSSVGPAAGGRGAKSNRQGSTPPSWCDSFCSKGAHAQVPGPLPGEASVLR